MKRGSLTGSGYHYGAGLLLRSLRADQAVHPSREGGLAGEQELGRGGLERELVGGPRRAGAGRPTCPTRPTRPTCPIEPGPIRRPRVSCDTSYRYDPDRVSLPRAILHYERHPGGVEGIKEGYAFPGSSGLRPSDTRAKQNAPLRGASPPGAPYRRTGRTAQRTPALTWENPASSVDYGGAEAGVHPSGVPAS